VVAAEQAAAVGEGFLVDGAGGARISSFAQAGGEIASGGQRVGVVGPEDLSADPACAFVER